MTTTQTSTSDRPVLAWWSQLLEALGSRYTHDPTRSGEGFENLNDPLKNPEGNVAGWGLDGGEAHGNARTGRLFLLRADGDYLTVLAGRGMMVIRSPADGVYFVEELTTEGRQTHRTCKSPAEAIEAVDKYVAESRSEGAPVEGAVQAGNVIPIDSRHPK